MRYTASMSESVKQFIYLTAVIASIILISWYTQPRQFNWMIWTACALALMLTTTSFQKRMITILLTGIAMALAVSATMLLSSFSAILLIIYFVFLAIISTYLSLNKPQFNYAVFFAAFFAIVASMTSIELSNLKDIIIAMMAGMIITLIWQLIFLPYFIRNKLRAIVDSTMKALQLLSNEIFSCYLQPEYIDNIYLFEHRLHEKKLAVLNNISHFYEINTKKYPYLLQQMQINERIYATLISCSMLRWQLTDYSTVSLWRQELMAIANTLKQIFSSVITSTEKLVENIDSLEAAYQHVLQIASREPLVLLLFIFHLKQLEKELRELLSDSNASQQD
ncbi:MAG: hypothetical protein ACD_46C00538G0003 [uncultured bacterium]|nr:MAG: hypothetical protein ACD_46C00538G0003 [uncultured bacterium]